MDFIVLGTILGASLMVVGSVLRDLVPRRLRVGDDATPWLAVRDRRRAVRVAIVGGRVATIAGVTILLATLALILIDPADRVALTLVIVLSVLAILACAGWVVWYRYQESTGAIQRRQLQAIAGRLGRAGGPSAEQRASRPRELDRTGVDEHRSGGARPVMASSVQAVGARRGPRREADDPHDPDAPWRPSGPAPRARTDPRLDLQDPLPTRSPIASAVDDRETRDLDRGGMRPTASPSASRTGPRGAGEGTRSRDTSRGKRG